MYTQTHMAEEAGFRRFLPDLTQPVFTVAKDQDINIYADTFNQEAKPPWLHQLTQTRQKLYEESFKMIATDG